jgi:hypothetical protein
MSGGMVMEQYKIYKQLQDRKRDYLEYRGASLDKHGNLLWAKEELETWAEGFDEAMAIVKEYM